MQLLPNDLIAAAAQARDVLASVARRSALEGTQAGAPRAAAMARAARAAVFADALLAALRGRLDALKTVAK